MNLELRVRMGLIVGALISACAASGDGTNGDAASGDAADGDAGDRLQACEGRAFITANLAPDGECTVDTESQTLPQGLYDVASVAAECDHPYMLSLLVNSCVPEALPLHSAAVTLRTINRDPIVFDRFEPALPNPFLVTTSGAISPSEGGTLSAGVVSVEAIPTAYAAQLDDFIGKQLLAEVRVFGTTRSDVDVDVETFVYPIRICGGCLQMCASSVPDEMALEEIYGEGVCRDNAGADGRLCLDSSC